MKSLPFSTKLPTPSRRRSSTLSVAATSHDQFHPFPRLPLELRLQIWNLALPGPRVVQVIEAKKRHMLTRQASYHWTSNSPSPILLRVCKESREEALRTYTAAFGRNENDGRVYVDFDKDTVFFGRRDKLKTLISHYGTLEIESIIEEDFMTIPSFSRIKKLAVTLNTAADLVEWDWDMLMKYALEEIVIVSLMTGGKSFKLGSSPRLVRYEDHLFRATMTYSQKNRLIDQAKLARRRFKERADAAAADGREHVNRVLPKVRLAEFEFTDGDTWANSALLGTTHLEANGLGIVQHFVV